MIENIEIIRSKRQTIAVEVKSNLRVIVRAPIKMKAKDIMRFVDEKSEWIEKHIEIVRQLSKQKVPTLTDADISALASKARAYIPERVAYYAEIMGITVGKITIRNQRTRWGSCSSNGNLNFNCLLMLCPPEICDYVVVHELCHRIEMNHSPRFWDKVGMIIPEYAQHRKWLRENGNGIIGRMS